MCRRRRNQIAATAFREHAAEQQRSRAVPRRAGPSRRHRGYAAPARNTDRLALLLGAELIVVDDVGDLLYSGGGPAHLGRGSLAARRHRNRGGSGSCVCTTPWTRWTFWQHTDRGAVPGIEGPVDLDLFAGTLGELHAAR